MARLRASTRSWCLVQWLETWGSPHLWMLRVPKAEAGSRGGWANTWRAWDPPRVTDWTNGTGLRKPLTWHAAEGGRVQRGSVVCAALFLLLLGLESEARLREMGPLSAPPQLPFDNRFLCDWWELPLTSSESDALQQGWRKKEKDMWLFLAHEAQLLAVFSHKPGRARTGTWGQNSLSVSCTS